MTRQTVNLHPTPSPAGYKLLAEIPVEFTGGAVVLGFGVPPKPDFWMNQGTPQAPHIHLAFHRGEPRRRRRVLSRRHGRGRPRQRALRTAPHYHEHYYGAFVLDPDGHNIEACCHDPA